jgi:hypothetical protein
MKYLAGLGIALVLVGCGSSKSRVATDAGGDGPADGGHDLAKNDTPEASPNDLPGDRANAADIVVDVPGGEASSVVDTGKRDAPTDPVDAADAVLDADAGESCACNELSGTLTKLSWSCFCSVESCQRKLADFVSYADGGKVLTSGNRTVLLREFADCNLVLVEAKPYGDYVPSSEYVFDRATGALLGAKVWLDDRQHSCPFAAGDTRWVFGYQSGSYPVSTTCQQSACLAGSGSCSGGVDAR